MVVLRTKTCPRDKADLQREKMLARGCEIVMVTKVLSDETLVDIWYRVTID